MENITKNARWKRGNYNQLVKKTVIGGEFIRNKLEGVGCRRTDQKFPIAISDIMQNCQLFKCNCKYCVHHVISSYRIISESKVVPIERWLSNTSPYLFQLQLLGWNLEEKLVVQILGFSAELRRSKVASNKIHLKTYLSTICKCSGIMASGEFPKNATLTTSWLMSQCRCTMKRPVQWY